MGIYWKAITFSQNQCSQHKTPTKIKIYMASYAYWEDSRIKKNE
jgi:hypothetical protein